MIFFVFSKLKKKKSEISSTLGTVENSKVSDEQSEVEWSGVPYSIPGRLCFCPHVRLISNPVDASCRNTGQQEQFLILRLVSKPKSNVHILPTESNTKQIYYVYCTLAKVGKGGYISDLFFHHI